MDKKAKNAKLLQRDFELIFVLDAIIYIVAFILAGFSFKELIVCVLDLVLLGFGIYYAKKVSKVAGILGIITAVLMILSFKLITSILGVFMLVHSIIYLVNYDKA